jgi:hypothetical protein
MKMYNSMKGKAGQIRATSPLLRRQSLLKNHPMDQKVSRGRSLFLFNAMDDFKWWNSDYPNPDTTCIEGKVIVTEANPPYSVTSVGIDLKMLPHVTQTAPNSK